MRYDAVHPHTCAVSVRLWRHHWLSPCAPCVPILVTLMIAATINAVFTYFCVWICWCCSLWWLFASSYFPSACIRDDRMATTPTKWTVNILAMSHTSFRITHKRHKTRTHALCVCRAQLSACEKVQVHYALYNLDKPLNRSPLLRRFCCSKGFTLRIDINAAALRLLKN